MAVEIFYGWFRQGLPTEPAELWSIKTEDLIAALKTAVELNIIPAQIAKSFDSLASVLDDLKLEVLLTPAGENQAASLGDLLVTMPQRLSPEKERIVAEAVRDRLTGDDLVKQLGGHIAFARPAGLTRDTVPTELVAKEREFAVEQAKATGKPQQIAEKIAEGKMNAFFAERVLLPGDPRRTGGWADALDGSYPPAADVLLLDPGGAAAVADQGQRGVLPFDVGVMSSLGDPVDGGRRPGEVLRQIHGVDGLVDERPTPVERLRPAPGRRLIIRPVAEPLHVAVDDVDVAE